MIEKDRLRLALIGCGYFARYHAAAWRVIPQVELVAVCDRAPERAQAFAEQFDVPRYYTNPEALFRAERLDIVDIVTTPESHRELVELAARYGVHVICQKPMALSEADCVAMVESCERAGVSFMVHENFRWQRMFRRARTLTEAIGEPFFLRLWFRSHYDVFARQPYLATAERFIILDLGVHLLDLARFLMRDEFSTLYCITQRVHPQIRGDDVATILLRSRRGAAASIELSYASFAPRELFPQTLALIEGPLGTVLVEADGLLRLITSSGHTEERLAPPSLPWQEPPGEWIQEAVLAIQQHFVDCLRRGLMPETHGRDNLRTMQLVFAAYRSADTTSSIALDQSESERRG
jgi:predicted dehydrogenase